MNTATIKRFLRDDKGSTDEVFKLVLAITIAAVVLIIILQMLHGMQSSGVAATTAAGDGLKIFAENVSREISG